MKKLMLIIMMLFSIHGLSLSLGQAEGNILSEDKISGVENRLDNIEERLERIFERVDENKYSNMPFSNSFFDRMGPAVIISVVAIVFPFIFAFAVIFISFYMKNKDRKAKYKLAEIALNSGKDIPDGLFVDVSRKGQAAKGIKNMCLGIGLFIFLWYMTHEAVLACIGVLVFFTGLGQFLIHLYTNYSERETFYNPLKTTKKGAKRGREDAVEFTAWEEYTDKDGNNE